MATKPKKSKALVVPPKGVSPANPSAELLIQNAIDKGVPVETMERLLAMRTQIKAEQAQEAFVEAMADFQAECPIIPKTKTVREKAEKGGGIRYSYAPLDVIVHMTKEILAKHGLTYTIKAGVTESAVSASCVVTHRLGHSEVSEFQVPIDPTAYMNTQQKFASALTFAKRYAFCNALGILTGDEDDDAKAAGDKNINTEQATDPVKAFEDSIEKSTTSGRLMFIRARVQSSKNLNDEQKDALSKSIDAKLKTLPSNPTGGK